MIARVITSILLTFGTSALAQESSSSRRPVETASPDRVTSLEALDHADNLSSTDLSEEQLQEISPLLIDVDQMGDELASQRMPDERLPMIIDEYDVVTEIADLQDSATWELFRYACRRGAIVSETVLFANGAIRAAEGRDFSKPQIGFLSDSQRDHFSRLIASQAGFARDFVDYDLSSAGPRGEMVQVCEIAINIPEKQPLRFVFGEFDTSPLWVKELSIAASELESRTRPSRVSEIPQDYAPTAGDFLRRYDGKLFQIVGITSDGKGVVLDLPLEPIREYYPLSDLSKIFVALIRESSLRARDP